MPQGYKQTGTTVKQSLPCTVLGLLTESQTSAINKYIFQNRLDNTFLKQQLRKKFWYNSTFKKYSGFHGFFTSNGRVQWHEQETKKSGVPQTKGHIGEIISPHFDTLKEE